MQIAMKMKANKSIVSSLMNTDKGAEIDYNQWLGIAKGGDVITLKSFMTVEGLDVNKCRYMGTRYFYHI